MWCTGRRQHQAVRGWLALAELCKSASPGPVRSAQTLVRQVHRVRQDGEYCAKASAALDDDAHLLLYSGRLAAVVDVGGLRSGRRNLFPKMGALGTALPARAAYDALAAATTDIELASTCGTKTSRYALRSVGNSFVHAGLVRQGHAVTHIILTGLRWGKASLDRVSMWAEVSVWGDSIAIELAWDGDFRLDKGCTGTVSMAVGGHSSSVALEKGGRRASSSSSRPTPQACRPRRPTSTQST